MPAPTALSNLVLLAYSVRTRKHFETFQALSLMCQDNSVHLLRSLLSDIRFHIPDVHEFYKTNEKREQKHLEKLLK